MNSNQRRSINEIFENGAFSLLVKRMDLQLYEKSCDSLGDIDLQTLVAQRRLLLLEFEQAVIGTMNDDYAIQNEKEDERLRQSMN